MKKPSKASFRAALDAAIGLKKPVFCGWEIFHSLRGPANVTWPDRGRADQKSLKWCRENFRDAWIVMPDGNAYNIFDRMGTTFEIEPLPTVKVTRVETTTFGWVKNHGIVEVPTALLADSQPANKPADLKCTYSLLVQQQSAAAESKEFTRALLATGKVWLQIPPEGFLWTGTEAEWDAFLQAQGLTAEKAGSIPR